MNQEQANQDQSTDHLLGRVFVGTHLAWSLSLLWVLVGVSAPTRSFGVGLVCFLLMVGLRWCLLLTSVVFGKLLHLYRRGRVLAVSGMYMMLEGAIAFFVLPFMLHQGSGFGDGLIAQFGGRIGWLLFTFSLFLFGLLFSSYRSVSPPNNERIV